MGFSSSVNFVDKEMLIPALAPMVFIGRNLVASDAGKVYFQDIESYRDGVRFDSASDEDGARFEFGSEDELGHVFEYEKGLEVLMACSLRRRASKL